MVKKKERLVLGSHCGDPDHEEFTDLFVNIYGPYDIYGHLKRGGTIRIFPYFGGAGHKDHWDSFIKQAHFAYMGLSLTDILMAAHDPCRWYSWYGPKPPTAENKAVGAPMEKDLMKRAKKLAKLCPNAEVRLFIGRPEEKGGPLIFKELNYL